MLLGWIRMESNSTIACLVWDFVAKEHILLSEYERREKERKKSSNPNSDSSVRDNSDDD